jgi:hypothetical protein
MSEHPNVARLRDVYAAFAALNGLFADDVLFHATGRNQVQGGYRGRDAVYGLFGKFMEITEGTFHIDVHAVLADDERGVALAVITGSVADRGATTNHRIVRCLAHRSHSPAPPCWAARWRSAISFPASPSA